MPPSSVFPRHFLAAPASSAALGIFQRHWPDYCREVAGLAALLLAALIHRRLGPASIASLPHDPVPAEKP